MAEVKWYGQKVYAEINSAEDKIINDLALFVHKEARDSMTGAKTGRIYRVPGFKKTYQASAEGEAPAIPTGGYRDSVIVEFVAPSHRRVGSYDKRARRLELGGMDKRGVYIGPRPHLRPALDKAAAKVDGIIGKHKL
jgi:hypothetical protein